MNETSRRDALRNRQNRVNAVNELVIVIARNGRNFFYRKSEKRYAKMIMKQNGRLYWVDDFTGDELYLHGNSFSSTRNFSHGETLKELVKSLKEFVMTGEKLHYGLGPWPDWICNGDLWGYGDDMLKVRDAAYSLGIFSRREKEEE